MQPPSRSDFPLMLLGGRQAHELHWPAQIESPHPPTLDHLGSLWPCTQSTLQCHVPAPLIGTKSQATLGSRPLGKSRRMFEFLPATESTCLNWPGLWRDHCRLQSPRPQRAFGLACVWAQCFPPCYRLRPTRPHKSWFMADVMMWKLSNATFGTATRYLQKFPGGSYNFLFGKPTQMQLKFLKFLKIPVLETRS